MSLYMALVHYPVMNKHGAVVTTSITNFDIHDMGRTARTYEVKRAYMVTPVRSQQWFAQRVINHWTDGWGADYNPTRQESMGRLEMADDLAQVQEKIQEREGTAPVFIGTSARHFPNSISYADLRKRLEEEPQTPFCLIFGTGWGLHPELVQDLDLMLAPIEGAGDYNHLPVRSAAAIILDRLCGRCW